jgi:hypothetical protein
MILFCFSAAAVYATAPFRFDQPWGVHTRGRSFRFCEFSASLHEAG